MELGDVPYVGSDEYDESRLRHKSEPQGHMRTTSLRLADGADVPAAAAAAGTVVGMVSTTKGNNRAGKQYGACAFRGRFGTS